VLRSARWYGISARDGAISRFCGQLFVLVKSKDAPKVGGWLGERDRVPDWRIGFLF
jgi:hypothetical protein